MNKWKIIIILCIIGIVLTLSVFATATYAYVTIEVKGGDGGVTINTLNKDMVITYKDTSNMALVNAYTGDEFTKTFTIENTGDTVAYYDILFENVVNDFANPDDLVYTLVSEDDGAVVSESVVPTDNSKIASNVKIDVSQKHTYEMKISFLKTKEDQSNNMNKTFSSNINVISSSMNSGEDIYKDSALGKIITNSVIGSENSEDFNNYVDGVYYTNSSNNGNTIYFYRGSKRLNNNVILNDICYKILRTTEDYGIRLVYNGISEDGSCNNTLNILEEKVSFNNNSNYNAYVGYMYGEVSSSDYVNEHKNLNSSNIKIILDNWYHKNLNDYSDFLSDNASYCNNRKTSKFTYKGVLYDNFGYSNNNTGYYVMGNIVNDKDISYKCLNDNDRLTIYNGLTYPVGLLTVEELHFAGYLDANNFLNINDSYWTMTPAYYNGTNAYNFIVTSNKLNQKNVVEKYGVRPVITVKNNTTVLAGSGTVDNPYRIIE